MGEGLPFARAIVWFLRLWLIPVAVLTVVLVVSTPPDAIASQDLTNFVAVTLPVTTVLKLLQVASAWRRRHLTRQSTTRG